MAFMTISSTRPDRRRRRAFSLVEVMIAATLGSMVLAGVMSTFLMLSRSGIRAVNYTTMDTQARRALEEFSQDIRMASNVTWNTAAADDPCYSITLTVPNNYNGASPANQVTYAWDNDSASGSYRCFYRKPGNAAATAGKQIFIRNVTSFLYTRYNRTNGAATTNASTKRVQIAMTVTTQGQANVSAANQLVAATNDQLVSASYILRNKSAN